MLPNFNLEYYEKSFFLHYLGMENFVDIDEFVPRSLWPNYIMVYIFYLWKLVKKQSLWAEPKEQTLIE